MKTPDTRPILGLDIGGTKLAAGLLDANGVLRSWQRTPTAAIEGPSAVLQRLTTLGFRALDAAGVAPSDVAAVGVGCGGPLDADRGVVLGAPNLPGWKEVAVAERLETAFGKPVCLDNDANAGALAEAAFGAARGARDLVYLTISTGVGGGVVSNGRLVRGATGNAAELGHLCVALDGRACRCGGRGCLEAYVSGTSIAERAREAIAAGEPSILVDLAGCPEAIMAETVVAAVRAHDPLARRLWSDTIDALAAGVASAIHAFNPEIVVLGGGVVASGSLLLEPLRREVAVRTMPQLAAGTRIVASSLREHLGVYGAAAVAGERLNLGPWSVRGDGAPSGSAAIGLERPRLTVVHGEETQEQALARPEPAAPRPEQAAPRPEQVVPDPEQAAARPPAPPSNGSLAAARDRAALAEHVTLAITVGERLLPQLDEIAEVLCGAIARGGRLVAFGNGGSAADAQHFVAELIGHYRHERPSLPAIALTTDPSVITCIANDYSFADVFARQVEALVGPEDVVVGISTSGNAPNVVRGLLAARLRGATTIALTGHDGGSAARAAAYALVVPSETTARIQEMHTLFVHLLSERVDDWAAQASAAGELPAPVAVRPGTAIEAAARGGTGRGTGIGG